MASMTAASMATPAGSEWNRPRRATSLLIAPGPDDAWLPENAGPQRKQPRGGLIPEGDVFASDVIIDSLLATLHIRFLHIAQRERAGRYRVQCGLSNGMV